MTGTLLIGGGVAIPERGELLEELFNTEQAIEDCEDELQMYKRRRMRILKNIEIVSEDD